MIRGSCTCGAVRFEIDDVRSLTHCHCINCRKLTGEIADGLPQHPRWVEGYAPKSPPSARPRRRRAVKP